MKKITIQMKEAGYAEINFEYEVEVPDNKVSDLFDSIQEVPVNTIHKEDKNA